MNVAFLEFSPDVENDGGVVGIAEGGGVVVVLLSKDGDVAFFGEGDLGGGVGVVFPVGDEPGGFGADALDLLQGGVGGAEDFGGGAKLLDQAFNFDRTGLRELVEGDEGFGFSHGSRWQVVREKDSRSSR
ncbi:hypothetical protein N9A86_02600 [Akkermansiaceae bacterium]|nr:hypothetical protein [Akkermansiaceae bacterium]